MLPDQRLLPRQVTAGVFLGGIVVAVGIAALAGARKNR
jgi:hypothetical protein